MKKILILIDIFEINALKSGDKKNIKTLEAIKSKFSREVDLLLGLIEDTSEKKIVLFFDKKTTTEITAYVEGFIEASLIDDIVIVYLLTDDPKWLDNGAPTKVSDLGINVYVKPNDKNLSRFKKILNAKIFPNL